MTVLVAACGSDQGRAREIAAHLPPGAKLLVEGTAPLPATRRVRSLAEVPASEIATFDAVLLDARVYRRSVRRGGPRADAYRDLARDPRFRPTASAPPFLLLERRGLEVGGEIALGPAATSAWRHNHAVEEKAAVLETLFPER